MYGERRNRYFYTVLFLDDYNPQKRDLADETMSRATQVQEPPVLKSFEIKKDSNSTDIHWTDSKTLFVRHGLPLPVTLELWDAARKPDILLPGAEEGD